ncbi:MAG TPA: phosphatidate cytidylyltransferase [Chitinophagaceae bacterium]
MALNRATFKTRAITAIVFAAIMLAGLLWNHWSFFILFSIIHFGCWWEYLKLTEKIHTTFFHPYIKLGLMLVGYGLMLWFCGPVYEISGYGLKENISLPVSIAGFVFLVMGIFQKNNIRPNALGVAAIGLIYISLSWGLMIDLSGFIRHLFYTSDIVISFPPFDYFSVLIPCAIILSIWINDTMAYIVGSVIGKTPLSKISPKKTWEGTIGGIVLCILATGFLFSSIPTEIVIPGFHFSFANEVWYIIAGIAAVAGTFGDLLESKLKRMANVKDSGSLMPGHGGFLDRFDSLLLATPFVWLYVSSFMK